MLHGKVVMVTGASSGVGGAIARAAGVNGARVALIARGERGLEQLAADLADLGAECLAFPVDVADASMVGAAAEQVVARWGGIDVWVNNAIVTVYSPISRMTPEEYRRVIEVDYLGTVHGTLAALQHMRPRDAGTIVQIGSALGYRSSPQQSACSASKAAVRGFTDSLRSELVHERSRIRVTMLQLPGRSVIPVSEPELIADALLYALEHRSEELWVGWSSFEAIVAQLLPTRALHRYDSGQPLLPAITVRGPGPRPFSPRAARPRTKLGALATGAALLVMGGVAAARTLVEAWSAEWEPT